MDCWTKKIGWLAVVAVAWAGGLGAGARAESQVDPAQVLAFAPASTGERPLSLHASTAGNLPGETPVPPRWEESDRPWHVELGFRDGYTKLEETSELLHSRLDGPLTLDWANFFDRPNTPVDRRSEGLMVTFYLGAGRQENDWLIWTVYGGGGMGRDHDHQRVGNVNLEVNFKYAYFYTGTTFALYPWRAPERDDYRNWSERLRASRPFVATGVETGYLSAEGRGNYKIAPLPRLYQDKVQIRDWITSFNLGGGWDLPLNRCWSVVLMGDYRFHFYRPEEYNGWTFTTALRYNFR